MNHVKAVMLDVRVASLTLCVRLRQSPGSPVLAIEDVDVPTLRAEI